MRLTSLAIACLMVSGCMQTTKVGESAKLADPSAPVTAAAVATDPKLTRDDCYTVVLFDKVRVKKPGADVPPEFAAFSGAWQKGAWAGEWCHDVLITEIRPDGSVDLFEMHAPHAEWGQPASAFKRTGRINEKGELRYRFGTTVITYTLVDGALHATRSGSGGGAMKAVLVNGKTVRRDKAGVPIAG